MKAYKDYMDRIELSEDQHASLMDALKEAERKAAETAASADKSGVIAAETKAEAEKKNAGKTVFCRIMRAAALPAAAVLVLAVLLPSGAFRNKENVNNGKSPLYSEIVSEKDNEMQFAPKTDMSTALPENAESNSEENDALQKTQAAFPQENHSFLMSFENFDETRTEVTAGENAAKTASEEQSMKDGSRNSGIALDNEETDSLSAMIAGLHFDRSLAPEKRGSCIRMESGASVFLYYPEEGILEDVNVGSARLKDADRSVLDAVIAAVKERAAE